ncbi:MAG: hypothetical protein HC902_08735 [Calothrix sp. SM1_5_4]|nr:hypothetical protein [Calothrix sp. SM1_5_4]
MRVLAIAFIQLFALSAFADLKVPVSLNDVSFDGKTISGTYSTGGGCQPHTAEVSVSLETKPGKYSTEVTARLSILDVVPAFDGCEALISVDFKVDVRDLLKKELDARSLDISRVSVVLPPVEANID